MEALDKMKPGFPRNLFDFRRVNNGAGRTSIRTGNFTSYEEDWNQQEDEQGRIKCRH